MTEGFQHHKQWFSEAAQHSLLTTINEILEAAPLYQPTMPKSGKPFSVYESNCGPLGWVSDINGYRYQATHPITNQPWPAMPAALTKLWRDLADYEARPEACLINGYRFGARMGLHQDKDEQDKDAPIISVSLGQSARFRIGGTTRRGKTKSIILASGDVIVMGGKSRMFYHGIDRLVDEPPSIQPLIADETIKRINLTLRRVTIP